MIIITSTGAGRPVQRSKARPLVDQHGQALLRGPPPRLRPQEGRPGRVVDQVRPAGGAPSSPPLLREGRPLRVGAVAHAHAGAVDQQARLPNRLSQRVSSEERGPQAIGAEVPAEGADHLLGAGVRAVGDPQPAGPGPQEGHRPPPGAPAPRRTAPRPPGRTRRSRSGLAETRRVRVVPAEAAARLTDHRVDRPDQTGLLRDRVHQVEDGLLVGDGDVAAQPAPRAQGGEERGQGLGRGLVGPVADVQPQVVEGRLLEAGADGVGQGKPITPQLRVKGLRAPGCCREPDAPGQART